MPPIKISPGRVKGSHYEAGSAQQRRARGDGLKILSFFFIFLCLIPCTCRAALENSLQFKMEFSKPEIFVGEQVFCHFAVYTTEEVVEVEVEKFPDFRGFWKDNLVLRQGPIPTTVTPHPQLRKAIIGSYLVIPMLGDLEPLVDPMKIVVRNPAAEALQEKENTVLESEGSEPRIKKLPPIKSKEMASFFTGAVGKFTLSTEKPILSFEKDEPTVLRLGLGGEGNFQDINDLPVTFPKGVEVLSKKTSIQGGGQYFTKTFEITLKVHGDQNFLLDPIHVLAFNPATSTYEMLELPPLTFQRMVRENDTQPLENNIHYGALEELPSEVIPIFSNPIFVALQGFLFLLFLAIYGVRLVLEKRAAYRASPAFSEAVRSNMAKRAGERGDIEEFLKLSERLAYEKLLGFITERNHSLSRDEVLAKAKEKVPVTVWKNAERLFKAYDAYLYSQSKSLPEEMPSLLDALNELMDKKVRI